MAKQIFQQKFALPHFLNKKQQFLIKTSLDNPLIKIELITVRYLVSLRESIDFIKLYSQG